MTKAEGHGRNEPEFTVSQLSGALKRMVEDAFGAVRLRGEISGYRGPHSSGHAYFALKDDKARLEAVIWRGSFSKLRFKPEEGMEVIVTGKLTTYPGSSKYQIVIETLEPAGSGALMALIEERRQRLQTEGLFDTARKKPLPFLPKVIGVITSPTGAVIRDILHRIRDRFALHILLWPVRVQGETTAEEAIAAVEGFHTLPQQHEDLIPRPDVIILARGGGSLEDLWGFNDEALVRSVANSHIPIISAIGHETDWTLVDFVADMRAPTPTAAAEMAVPVRAELEAAVASLSTRLNIAISRLQSERRQRLTSLMRAMPSLDYLLALPRRRFDEAERRSSQAFLSLIEKKRSLYGFYADRLTLAPLERQYAHARDRLSERGQRSTRAITQLLAKKAQTYEALSRLLATVDTKNILARGFALVLDEVGVPIKQAASIQKGERLILRFHDGQIDALAQMSKHSTSSPSPPPKKQKSSPQGSLF